MSGILLKKYSRFILTAYLDCSRRDSCQGCDYCKKHNCRKMQK